MRRGKSTVGTVVQGEQHDSRQVGRGSDQQSKFGDRSTRTGHGTLASTAFVHFGLLLAQW
jgi:hypothetical protein